MKELSILVYLLLSAFFFSNCSEKMEDPILPINGELKILTLGDSYTFGQSVCPTCNFPSLLVDSLETGVMKDSIQLLSIARTGWTTSNLLSAIDDEMPASDYDIVTLLIGVNNQYQGKNFSIMEAEFPLLVSKSIELADGDKDNVILLSIPDYAFTPFGQNFNPDKISEELDEYNEYIEAYADSLDITFFNITDITREGLDKPELVAGDGLHPSEVAYKRFVDRMYSYVYQQVTE